MSNQFEWGTSLPTERNKRRVPGHVYGIVGQGMGITHGSQAT